MPSVNDLDNFPHKRTFAFCRAGVQIFAVKTVLPALPGAGESFLKNRPLIQIFKFAGFDGKRPPAGVVEEKQPFCQGIEVDLVTDDENIRVGQEIVPGLPDGLADRAGFK